MPVPDRRRYVVLWLAVRLWGWWSVQRLSRDELMALMDDQFDVLVTTLDDAGG